MPLQFFFWFVSIQPMHNSIQIYTLCPLYSLLYIFIENDQIANTVVANDPPHHYRNDSISTDQYPLLLTRFNFNPSIDK